LALNVTHAQPPARPGPGGGGAVNVVERIMSRDQNKDGKVSKDELPGPMRDRLLERFDANQDGVIERAEAEKAAAAAGRGGPGTRGPGMNRPDPERILQRLRQSDRNGDGNVTKDELPEPMRDRMLQRFDANHDGVIDKAEVKKGAEIMRSQGPARRAGPPDKVFIERILTFDKNDDGKVSLDELPSAMRFMIRRADANGDGIIERSELEKMEGRGAGDPQAAKDDVGRQTASHVEVEPLPISFGELAALRLRKDGNLLATDSEEGLIKLISPSGDLLATFDPGFHPEVIDLDGEGAIYCGGEGVVAKMTADGKLLNRVELPQPTESDAPRRRAASPAPGISGLAVGDDAVYVTFGSGWSLSAKAKLYRFGLDLEEPQLLAEGLKGCCQHCDIAFRDGVLFLAENSAFRVVLYDRDGNVLNKWGSKSRDDLKLFGGCCNPMNVALDARGTLYTAESGLGRVKRYSPEGEFLGLVGYLDVERFTRGGVIAASCCHMPIAVTPDGDRVYVTDVKENTIRVLERKPS
jgi:Ca2+-binding EF-hand superfamily protein